jgi:hypothetical protein
VACSGVNFICAIFRYTLPVENLDIESCTHQMAEGMLSGE